MSQNVLQKTEFKKKYDEYLPTLNSIFSKARFFGVSSFGLTVSFCWSFILFLMLLVLESYAIMRLCRVLGGWAVHVSDGHGLLSRLAGSIFYGNALLSLLLLSKFIHSWRNLSTFWTTLETTMGLQFPPDRRIKKRTKLVTGFVAIFATVEHILSMISAIGFDCPPEQYFSKYILSSHGFLLEKNYYSLWTAIPVFILSKLATALWTFQDLIIILISMGLTSRYDRLNLYVSHVVTSEKRLKGRPRFGTDLFRQIQLWRNLREAYVRQATLVRLVDRKIGPLVLLSNINNFFFICYQLFNGIHEDKGSTMNKCYYLLSLGWLLLRAGSVVLAAADVHQHSQRALKHLFLCPSTGYNIEIKRLQYQLTNNYIALTGMGFFHLRRKLLLEVAAAILKYELVLIQYDTL